MEWSGPGQPVCNRVFPSQTKKENLKKNKNCSDTPHYFRYPLPKRPNETDFRKIPRPTTRDKTDSDTRGPPYISSKIKIRGSSSESLLSIFTTK